MIRGIHTANRNLNVLQKKLENSGSNMANVKTPGYKFQNLLHTTMESKTMLNYQRTNKLNRKQEIGQYVFGNEIDGSYRSFQQGSIQNTMNETDFAIVGDGFFTIRMENGQIGYTRNGNFIIDEDNMILTSEGYEVLGRSGENLYLESNEFIEFGIVEFQDLNNLESVGETLFVGAGGTQVEYPNVKQGFIELSNVNIADEMVSLIELSRQFESTQKVVNAIDETLSKAVNEIGRV